MVFLHHLSSAYRSQVGMCVHSRAKSTYLWPISSCFQSPNKNIELRLRHPSSGTSLGPPSGFCNLDALQNRVIKSQRQNSLCLESTKSSDIYDTNNREIVDAIPSNENDEDSDSDAIRQAYKYLQPHFPFPLDPWQLSAGASLLASHNVIVCAPTGAGKTVVGEMALRIAIENNTKAIYTTPLKALSNQKFGEMRKIFGVDRVGLSTGDISIRRGADITIMTTEVYRNMAWRARTSPSLVELIEEEGMQVDVDKLEKSLQRDEYDDLSSNSIVVLDEFHYMGQKGRGSTWEECVITNPPHTQIVGLSATLPNAHRLAAWMESVTGRKTVLVEASGGRPVPLRYYFATNRILSPLFRDEQAGPGAPHGLLGLRGDGVDPSKIYKKKTKKKLEKYASIMQGLNERGLPRGLDLHPTLQSAAEKQQASIDRRLQRMMARESYGDYNGYGKGPTMSLKEQRKAKENMLKKELRKSVPSVTTLLRRLQQEDLLPSIFFIFSRVGCDNAAVTLCEGLKADAQEQSFRRPSAEKKFGKTKDIFKGKGRGRGQGRRSSSNWDLNEDELVMIQDSEGRNFRADLLDQILSDEYDSSTDQQVMGLEDEAFMSEGNLQQYATIGLLSLREIKEAAQRLLSFNTENPEIAFDDSAVERILCGIGSHHAGVLPAHKAFIESLFRIGLMKVIFATETLAAGINAPARSTIICSMAKRGDNAGMELLETSNMLQMAGRAGRRGMDIEGACIIAATAFEGPEDAITILTNEIKPIVSQFSPSYALAINLIDRGGGKLEVARSMIQKSFAVWESQQREQELETALESLDINDENRSPEELFLNALQLTLEKEIIEARDGTSPRGTSKSAISKLDSLVDVLSDGKNLKKISKKYSGAAQMLELEQSTLKYLEREFREMDQVETMPDNVILPENLFDDDKRELLSEIKTQRSRVTKGEREINGSIIAALAKVANNRMKNDTEESIILREALKAVRTAGDDVPFVEGAPLEPGELNTYIMTAPKTNRRRLLTYASSPSEEKNDECWNQMLSLLNVLEAFGCLKRRDVESDEITVDDRMNPEKYQFTVTSGGTHVGSLGTDNSLWQVCALGGAFDVAYESAELDKFQDAFSDFESDKVEDTTSDLTGVPKPQKEAQTLTSLLCNLSASEMAGYVSSLVVDAPRNSASALESFQKLTNSQQRVVQSSLLSLERLLEVQRKYNLDDSIGRCQLELSSADVVTAWASGCSWLEALEISGQAPGDLVRTLSRALDALRQISNLPFVPARGTDGDGVTIRKESGGIHPRIRALCREASSLIDRYPVKDMLPFEADDEETNRERSQDEDDDNEEPGNDYDDSFEDDQGEVATI